MRMRAYVLLGSLVAASGLLPLTFDRAQGEDQGAAGQSPAAEDTAVATFAGGCFWCMQHPFDKLDGVVSTTVGYTGGHVENPSYGQVSAGGTGHAESVNIVYEPNKVGYDKLLNVFWHNVDPLDAGGQFCDRGSQYRTAIFYHNSEQKRLAEESKIELAESGRFDKPIVTNIVAASTFYDAEDYHQDYYKKNPLRYKYYRWQCGRDQRLEQVWGDDAPSHAHDGAEEGSSAG